ncbi:hypothetical protein GCM10027447_03390 [Glycomyces halotolerans]
MAQQQHGSQASVRRIYVPANLAILGGLAETGEWKPAEPVHMVTAALRRAFPEADVEDLEYTAFADAALASVALLVGEVPRRVVISADVPARILTEHADGTAADLDGSVKRKKVAAVHIDDADAAEDIAEALASPEGADLEAVEAHVLDWYDPSELDEVVSALGSSRP